ncbi:MAG: hypothetical protein A3C06_02860 [Candidatus Taylorbacteria bacterium RIFCSPHIGHO2_02_FULL_46_13]|uniref:Glycosyltransferase 2-like domain-containing protein n=1 Tax=Candidatus Taylorbacteria bacterium RIFCSPHIGHO2_02_FULL_46_13 TaxID=1802312 RepID=A0A1G2MRK7_9BACT|nr:MAG: hypothetical protein A3C06_02860 [Candidatus Taylorbacteria bacterium RIFCSPHIGHO2_02_FULL_46_13]
MNLPVPKVSVLMPVYNASLYVREAIQSILNQTFTDFELIVVDDASADDSASVIRSIHDERIRFVQNHQNKGIVHVRNQLLSYARGAYIAILDGDDIAYQRRLEIQVAYLDKNPSFGLLGTWTEVIDKDGTRTGIAWKDTFASEKIPMMLLFHNCFTQSSVMLRRVAIPPDGYRQRVELAEDYDLWIRISEKWKCANLPPVLTAYRRHPEGITSTAKDRNHAAIETVARDTLTRLGINPEPPEYLIHKTNYGYGRADIIDFLEKRERWLTRLREANIMKKIYDEMLFSEVLAERWLISCSFNARGGFSVWKCYWKSPLADSLPLRKNLKEIAKFALKTVLKK